MTVPALMQPVPGPDRQRNEGRKHIQQRRAGLQQHGNSVLSSGRVFGPNSTAIHRELIHTHRASLMEWGGGGVAGTGPGRVV